MATPGISRRTILHGTAATLAGLASRPRPGGRPGAPRAPHPDRERRLRARPRLCRHALRARRGLGDLEPADHVQADRRPLGLAARPRPRAEAGGRHPRPLHASPGRPVDERIRRGDGGGREVLVRAIQGPQPEVRERGGLEAPGARGRCRQVHRGHRSEGAVPRPLDLVPAAHLGCDRVQEGGRGRRAVGTRTTRRPPAGRTS